MSRGRLARRVYLAAPAWSIVVGVLVVLVSALLTAAPRAAVGAAETELRAAIADIRGAGRDLATTVSTAGGFTAASGIAPTLEPGAAAVYGALDEQLAAFADSAAPGLRDRLGQADFMLRSGELSAPAEVARPGVPLSNVRLGFDPRILERVEVVAGAAPAAPDGSVIIDPVTESVLAEIDVMMSVDAAERVAWQIGEGRVVRSLGLILRLSGTFAARDPDATVWQHVPSALQPEVFDDGNTAARSTGMAYLAAGAVTRFPVLAASATRLTAWFPFDASGLTLADAAATLAELRGFTQSREQVPAIGNATLRFSSTTVEAIERVLARSDSTTALLVLVGSGPLGVALAVLGLAAHGVVSARRPTLELAAARGASPGALRRALAAEGALVGIPAAALGALAALAATPGPVGWPVVAVAAAVGLAPAAVFAARANFPLRRAPRRDLGASTRGRIRLAADFVVTALAALATVLLIVGGGRTEQGIDPLALAAPLLLAIAGALLAERLLPGPAGVALRRASAGTGLAGFLGLARAVRDPSGSVAHLALVVALAVATASAVLLTTLDRGTVSAAIGTLGGDVRIEGGALSADDLEALAATPGVDVLSGIEAIGSVTLTEGRERLEVPAYVVDGAALARLQPGFPTGLDGDDTTVRFVASDALSAAIAGVENTIEGRDARLVGVATGAAGIGAGEWLLVDRSASEAIGAGAFVPRVVVAGVEAGADPREVADALATEVGTAARVDTLDDRVERQRATPIASTLRVGFVIAIVIAAVLAVAAILMTARLATARRTALARTLRELGADRRSVAAVSIVETLPPTLAALLVGGVLGAGIPFLVVAAVDLAPIVGGIAPPPIAADPVMLGALVLGALAAGAVGLLPALPSARKDST